MQFKQGVATFKIGIQLSICLFTMCAGILTVSADSSSLPVPDVPTSPELLDVPPESLPNNNRVALPTDEHALFLPLLLKDSFYRIDNAASCTSNPPQKALLMLMQAHPEQGRRLFICNPILTQVAQERAEDMARRHYFDVVTPEGFGANYLVREAGYALPSFYDTSVGANNVESITAGRVTAESAWNSWMNSAGHQIHLLGTHAFYAAQIEFGIGYVYDPSSDYHHYWVVITAQPEE